MYVSKFESPICVSAFELQSYCSCGGPPNGGGLGICLVLLMLLGVEGRPVDQRQKINSQIIAWKHKLGKGDRIIYIL